MIDVFWPGAATLGEGPLWDDRLGLLYWVDILKGTIYRADGATAEVISRHVGAEVGCVGLTDDPRTLIAGLRTGWHLVDFGSAESRLLAHPERDRPGCRFNDGAVDPTGRFWTGSLEDGETRAVGRLYRLDPDGEYTVVDEGFYCSNGIDWSPAGDVLYFVDSRKNRIYRYPFDPVTGLTGERELFVDTTELDGLPDGLRVDAAGDVWCAFWGGAHVSRFDARGALAERIDVPVLCPTSIAFGGPDLRTMFITSAVRDLTESERRQWPLSGSVLRRDGENPGRQVHRFTMTKKAHA